MINDHARISLGQVERLMLELVLQGTGDAGMAAAQHLSAGGARVRARLAATPMRGLRISLMRGPVRRGQTRGSS